MNFSYQFNEFNDIDCFTEYINKFGDARSIQIKPGTLLIKEHFLQVGDLVIYRNSTNRSMLDRFSLHPGHMEFILTPPVANLCNWCGINVPSNSLAILHPGEEYLALIQENWNCIGIMIKIDTATRQSLLSEDMWQQTMQPETAIIDIESPQIMLLWTQLLSYFQNPARLRLLRNNKQAIVDFNNWVFDQLRMIFMVVEKNRSMSRSLVRNVSKRYRMFTKAIELIEQSLTEPLSTKQICDQIGTTPRTLQLCFNDLAGISPVQYITARKLHAVRENLFSSKKNTKLISYLSQDYGFQHAGRFSSQYQRMFCELPSVTLKRRKSF